MTAAAVGSRRPAQQASLVEQMIRRTSEAAAVFESRWTMRALRRVDAELCQAVDDQLQLFHEAILTGEDEQIVEHGEAMCRGWAAAVACMERAQEPDDAALIGRDVKTGMIVAIGHQRSASARVRELHGERLVFLTPDEVATLFAGLQNIAKVKELWPNSEIVDVREKVVELYPDDPAQED